MSKHFTEVELSCKCGCGDANMDNGFIALLERVRVAYGRGMVLSSAYRCKAHNEAVGGVPQSPHLLGRAVDVRTWSTDAHQLINVAMHCGVSGIGVSQKGTTGRFIHLDNMPRKAVWSY